MSVEDLSWIVENRRGNDAPISRPRRVITCICCQTIIPCIFSLNSDGNHQKETLEGLDIYHNIWRILSGSPKVQNLQQTDQTLGQSEGAYILTLCLEEQRDSKA